MKYNVGDYLKNLEECAYKIDPEVEEWMTENCPLPYLYDRWQKRDAPEIGVKGTVMFIAPITRYEGGKPYTGIYFLSDEGKGYILDEENFEEDFKIP